MKEIILFCLSIILWCCSSKPVNELDAMSKEVIKEKTGVDIQIKPIEEEHARIIH